MWFSTKINYFLHKFAELLPAGIMTSQDFTLPDGRSLTTELSFSATRSSGPGGQNVNKVSTKVELRFNVADSTVLSEDEKALLMDKLAKRVTHEGELVLVSQSERTQLKNKLAVTEKFYSLIAAALKPRKKRKPTRPSAAAREKRLENKKIKSEQKAQRSKINP